MKNLRDLILANPLKISGLIVFFICLCVVFQILLNPEKLESDAKNTPTNHKNFVKIVKQGTIQGPAKDPRISEMFGDGSQIRQFSRTDADRYLESKGETPRTLTASFWLTKDQRYLLRLKEIAGDDLIAISTLALSLGGWDDRLEFAEKMVKLDPSNKVGYLLKMQILLGKNDLPGAIKSLESANSALNFDQYDAEKIIDQREAWQIVGENATTARVRVDQSSSASTALPWYIANTVRDMWKATSSSMTEEDKLKAATQFLGIAASLANSTKLSTARTETISAYAETQILKQLPGDIEYGETGKTVEMHMKERQEETKKLLSSYSILEDRLAEASSNTIDQYFQRIDTLGTKAAMEWLLSIP